MISSEIQVKCMSLSLRGYGCVGKDTANTWQKQMQGLELGKGAASV